MMARRLCCAAMFAAVACAQAPPPAPPDPAEAARHRAALATIVMDNQTAHPLTVTYHIPAAAGGGGDSEVQIGVVPAGGQLALAPVPAGEPIVLIARTTAGTSARTGPRAFGNDERWTWRVVPGSLLPEAEQ